VEVEGPDDVKRNWYRIKAEEDGGTTGDASVLDGIPTGLPALQRASKMQNRAARVGFDWEGADHVLPKVVEELDELAGAMAGEGDVEAELGDVVFSVINLARHLGVDPELALQRANETFELRFRRMEAEGSLEGLDLDGLNERWERAKIDPSA
jgi:MazG family protein